MEVKCPVKNCKYFDKPMPVSYHGTGVTLYKCPGCGHEKLIRDKNEHEVGDWKGAWEST